MFDTDDVYHFIVGWGLEAKDLWIGANGVPVKDSESPVLKELKSIMKDLGATPESIVEDGVRIKRFNVNVRSGMGWDKAQIDLVEAKNRDDMMAYITIKTFY